MILNRKGMSCLKNLITYCLCCYITEIHSLQAQGHNFCLEKKGNDFCIINLQKKILDITPCATLCYETKYDNHVQ